MVSPQNPSTTDVAPGALSSGRGFVQEEITTVSTAPTYGAIGVRGYSYPVYFWGSVIAGSLLVISLFVLSYMLMLGCHVGVTSAGMLSLGWGAAVWIVITSALAYYFGGMLSNCISRPVLNGWVKGATIWGLSIPLVLVIGAIMAGGGGLLTGLNLPHFSGTIATTANNVQQVANNLQPSPGLNFGFVWTGFITLIVGLIFSIFGAASMPAQDRVGTDGRTINP